MKERQEVEKSCTEPILRGAVHRSQYFHGTGPRVVDPPKSLSPLLVTLLWWMMKLFATPALKEPSRPDSA